VSQNGKKDFQQSPGHGWVQSKNVPEITVKKTNNKQLVSVWFKSKVSLFFYFKTVDCKMVKGHM